MTKQQRKAKKLEAGEQQRVEIARSFSFKMNMGNYESRDFFCSQKAECALEDADKVADALHAFCKSQVLTAVNDYKAECEALARAERLAVNERKVELQTKKLQNVRPDYRNGEERLDGPH